MLYQATYGKEGGLTFDFELFINITNAVISIKTIVDMEDLTDQAKELEIDLKELDDIEDSLDLEEATDGRVDTSPVAKSAILFEKPEEFRDRTVNTNAARKLARQLVSYGETPNKGESFAYTEDNEVGTIFNEFIESMLTDKVDFKDIKYKG